MGVMLSLDGPRQARGRKGQHSRTSDEQACMDAFAAFLNYDASRAGRCLSRVGRRVLAAKVGPAAKALADAVELVLADDPRPGRAVLLEFTVSPQCLLGQCRGSGGTAECCSRSCEHDCHAGALAVRSGKADPAA